MIRPELHSTNRSADALSRPPARPHFDSVAWNRRRQQIEREAESTVAALLAKVEQARPARRRAEAA